MSIHKGSALRVNVPLIDIEDDGTETPRTPSEFTDLRLRIVKPDGTATEVTDPPDEDDVPYWEAEAEGADPEEEPGDLDQVGTWKVQGIADGYKSAPVEFKVSRNP